jgi:hypothetical protein
MAPRDRRALWPRPGAHVPFAHLFSDPLGTPLQRQSLFSATAVSRAARRARCDRRIMSEIDMSEIDLGIGMPAWPALIRHPRKKKR